MVNLLFSATFLMGLSTTCQEELISSDNLSSFEDILKLTMPPRLIRNATMGTKSNATMGMKSKPTAKLIFNQTKTTKVTASTLPPSIAPTVVKSISKASTTTTRTKTTKSTIAKNETAMEKSFTIMGGPANKSDYKYTVFIYEEGNGFRGTGSLVTPRHVLTSVTALIAYYVPSDDGSNEWKYGLRERMTIFADKYKVRVGSDYGSKKGEILPVSMIDIHPNFRAIKITDRAFENAPYAATRYDVALLKLANDISPKTEYKVIDLSKMESPQVCFLPGWDVNSQIRRTPNFQEHEATLLRVHVSPEESCRHKQSFDIDIKKYPKALNEMLLTCAEADNVENEIPCNFDKGGGLVCEDGKLYGVLSSGFCDQNSVPLFFTRTSSINPWFEKIKLRDEASGLNVELYLLFSCVTFVCLITNRNS